MLALGRLQYRRRCLAAAAVHGAAVGEDAGRDRGQEHGQGIADPGPHLQGRGGAGSLEAEPQTAEYALLKTYPICRWSGELGPKIKEGDRQAPEGFYTITPGQMNPNSNYYLAFNTGFPNAYDRSWGRTGSELMVHGDCSSRGCYAMTDEQMQEIYALARESFFGGQKAFQLQAYPFRMTATQHGLAPQQSAPRLLEDAQAGLRQLRSHPGRSRRSRCARGVMCSIRRSRPNASTPLKFDAKGACPVFELDKNIADTVLDHRRKEQVKMAEYIAQGVATVPPRHGIDGGMNAVFAEKIGVQERLRQQEAARFRSLPRRARCRVARTHRLPRRSFQCRRLLQRKPRRRP